MSRPDYDVLVVGGAMAGAGIAALLARLPETAALRVGLLEPRPAPAPATGEPLDLRVSALSRASERLLLLTGAWPAVAARGAGAYVRMVVWESRGRPDGSDALSFDAAEIGEPDLGHIAENRSIQAALLDSATSAGVVLIRAGLAGYEPGAAAATLTTTDGRRLRASLVVGADGSDSTLRRLAGIEDEGRDYGQRAVVTHLRSAEPHRQTAWQRFLDTGPLALLPLADGRVSLVWTTTPEAATALAACDEAEFNRAVTEASDSVLGTLQATAARASFPLRMLQARRYAGERLALIGDAAHTVHPLAGQGVNLGFMDAAALAELAGQALADGDDPGERRVLRRYERWRRAEDLPAALLLDGIQRLFSGDAPLRSWLRRSGLGLVDRSGPLRRALMQRALGTAGEVPAPLRGADR